MSIFDDIVAAIDKLGQVAKIEAGEATLTALMAHNYGHAYFKWQNGLGSTPSEFAGHPFEYRPYLEGWRITGVAMPEPRFVPDDKLLPPSFRQPSAPVIQSDDFNEVEARRYARLKANAGPAPTPAPKESFLLLFWNELTEEWVPHPVLLDSERSAAFTATNKAINDAAYGKTKIIPLGVLDNG